MQVKPFTTLRGSIEVFLLFCPQNKTAKRTNSWVYLYKFTRTHLWQYNHGGMNVLEFVLWLTGTRRINYKWNWRHSYFLYLNWQTWWRFFLGILFVWLFVLWTSPYPTLPMPEQSPTRHCNNMFNIAILWYSHLFLYEWYWVFLGHLQIALNHKFYLC
jgi:hypothetical protein